MLAASRKKDISSLILLGAAGTTGSELILEQQRHALDQMNPTDDERKAKIELQTRIQNAVLTGKGWENIPDDLRTQAETPWFSSLLAFDPAKVMAKVKQPVLIMQGELDKQVLPHHADKLAELARGRKKAPVVEEKRLPGINHLLVPATTGEVSEYGVLTQRTIAPEVGEAIAVWLSK
jgi:hypothetical protein